MWQRLCRSSLPMIGTKPCPNDDDESCGKDKRVWGKKKKKNNKTQGKVYYDQDEELRNLRERIFPEGIEEELERIHEESRRRIESANVVGVEDSSLNEQRERLLGGRPTREDLANLDVSRCVKVFCSSTFKDTVYERDCFIAFFRPALQLHCRKLGLDFQFLEMRWGITKHAIENNLFTDLCLEVVEKCQQESAAIGFLGILGNRYGYRPIPASVNCGDFATIFSEPKKAIKHYNLDENLNPPAYLLKPIGFDEETQLRDLLIDDKSWRSLTEQEMKIGFKSSDSILVIRSLDGIETANRSQDSSIDLYLDTTENSRELLDQLKEKLCEDLPKDSIIKTEVSWKMGGIDPKHPDHAAYLAKLLWNVHGKVVHSIERAAMKMRSNQLHNDMRQDGLPLQMLYQELLEHERFARSKLTQFLGRGGLVNKIIRLLAENEDVLVTGVAGSGKTSLLAAVSKELPSTFHVSMRFCGLTAATQTRTGVFETIYNQLSCLYGVKMQAWSTHTDLLEILQTSVFPKATKERPLIIIIDGVDQLEDQRSGRLPETWLPSTIGTNVSILASFAISELDHDQSATSLAMRCGNIVECQCLQGQQEAEFILNTWLENDRRKLTEIQRKALLRSATQGQTASYLFFRLLYHETLRWKSFDEPTEEFYSCVSIDGAMKILFDRLETEHGAEIVRHCLGVLTAATEEGLSAVELEDLASLNDDVLKSVLEHWVPPIARVPSLVIERLLFQLKEFLVDGRWHHRLLRDAARKRYVLGEEHYEALEAYFSGSVQNVHQVKLDKKDGLGRQWILSAQRFPAPQPWDFGNGLANRRKALELTSAKWELARISNQLDNVLMHATNINLIVAMVQSKLTGYFLNFVEKTKQSIARIKEKQGLELISDNEYSTLTTLQSTIALCQRALQRDGREFPIQWLLRTGDMKNPSGFCKTLTEASSTYCPMTDMGCSVLIPITPGYGFQHPHGPVKFRFSDHVNDITALQFFPDGVHIASMDEQGTIFTWTWNGNSEMPQLHRFSTSLNQRTLNISRDGRMIICGTDDKHINIWDIHTNNILRTVDGSIRHCLFLEHNEVLFVEEECCSIRTSELTKRGEDVKLNSPPLSCCPIDLPGSNLKMALALENRTILLLGVDAMGLDGSKTIDPLFEDGIVAMAASKHILLVAEDDGLLSTYKLEKCSIMERNICPRGTHVLSLAVAANMFIAGLANGSMTTWECSKFKLVPKNSFQIAPGVGVSALSLYIDQNKILAAASTENTVSIVDLRSTKSHKGTHPVPDWARNATSCSFVKDGSRIIVSGMSSVVLLDVETGEVLRDVALPAPASEIQVGGLQEFAVMLLAPAKNKNWNKLVSWDMREGRIKTIWRRVDCFYPLLTSNEILLVVTFGDDEKFLCLLDTSQQYEPLKWKQPLGPDLTEFQCHAHPSLPLCLVSFEGDEGEKPEAFVQIHDLKNGDQIILIRIERAKDFGEALWTSDGQLLVITDTMTNEIIQAHRVGHDWRKLSDMSECVIDIEGPNKLVRGSRMSVKSSARCIGVTVDSEVSEWMMSSTKRHLAIIQGGEFDYDSPIPGSFDLFRVKSCRFN